MPYNKDKYLSRSIVSAKATIENKLKGKDIICPSNLIVCFQKRLFQLVSKNESVSRIPIDYPPILVFSRGDSDIGIVGSFGIGAPAATVALELCIELGASNIFCVGYAGSLQPNLVSGDVVLCSKAIRDEGTSHHYLPPSEFVEGTGQLLTLCKELLMLNDIKFCTGTSWTTDAPYRETEYEVRKLQTKGVLIVEMELAAIYAVAQMKGVSATGICVVSDELGSFLWRPSFHDPQVVEGIEKIFHLILESI